MWIITVLAIFGPIGIIQVVKVLGDFIFFSIPRLTIDDGNFFDRKFGLNGIDSLGKYLVAKIRLKSKLNHIKNITDTDISDHDVHALNELKEFIQYLLSRGSMKTGTHCKYTLKYGKLDLYMQPQESVLKKSVGIRFESFTSDSPVLVIILDLDTGEFETSYSFRSPKLYVRFKEPNIKLINEIKWFIKIISMSTKTPLLCEAN